MDIPLSVEDGRGKTEKGLAEGISLMDDCWLSEGPAGVTVTDLEPGLWIDLRFEKGIFKIPFFLLLLSTNKTSSNGPLLTSPNDVSQTHPQAFRLNNKPLSRPLPPFSFSHSHFHRTLISNIRPLSYRRLTQLLCSPRKRLSRQNLSARWTTERHTLCSWLPSQSPLLCVKPSE